VLANIDQAISKCWMAVPPSEKSNPLVNVEAAVAAAVSSVVSK
jgi:hypothetical protein